MRWAMHGCQTAMPCIGDFPLSYKWACVKIDNSLEKCYILISTSHDTESRPIATEAAGKGEVLGLATRMSE